MDSATTEAQQELIQQIPKRHPRKTRSKLYYIVLTLIILFSLALWGSLVYGGYWWINQYLVENKAYFDTRVVEIEMQNQKDIDDLQIKLDDVYGELLNVKNELVLIQEDLALTGETLNGTDKTKQALQVRIDQLSVQLNELQASIQRLEDAANN